MRVAEAKSFSAAARRLQLSKSVVSKHVTQLESNMGVRLLNRTTRYVTLTEVGRQFYESCTDILRAAEAAERAAMQQQSSVRGTVKIAAPVSFGIQQIAPTLPQLREKYPDLCIDLTLTNRTVNLVEEGYDCAVLIDTEPSLGMVARRIAPVQRCICSSPEYIARYGKPETLDELKDRECILLSGASGGGKWRVRGPDGELSISVAGKVLINNLNAIRGAVLNGGGIALLPEHLILGDLKAGRLIALLEQHKPAPGSISTVYPSHRYVSPKVRAFIDFLVERFGSGRDWVASD